MPASPLDIIVIAAYLIGITAFGIWIGFRRHASTDQCFLANKSLGWFTAGAAVFTSNISTIHLVGLAAGGAKAASTHRNRTTPSFVIMGNLLCTRTVYETTSPRGIDGLRSLTPSRAPSPAPSVGAMA